MRNWKRQNYIYSAKAPEQAMVDAIRELLGLQPLYAADPKRHLWANEVSFQETQQCNGGFMRSNRPKGATA